ncbi:DUF2937 family protein [Gemmobacter serpentinus]|uniref:DUF2937 family protein n=1 Tax=Gemmobacter serpentinus TaxID=2652247 RepID=UPI001CF62504|nr:DUF2937 family protein [Gemmobacter serpentinus]
MLRILALAGGIAGGASLSQFPEFSQQYLQRLAGQVDSLALVVADFDRSATRNLLTRDEALAQMTGTAFLDDRRADLTATFARFARLEGNLADLRAASPLQRMTMPHKLGDAETLAATWADFRPAVPVTFDGLISAGIGFLGGWLVASGLLSLLAWPFRRIFA